MSRSLQFPVLVQRLADQQPALDLIGWQVFMQHFLQLMREGLLRDGEVRLPEFGSFKLQSQTTDPSVAQVVFKAAKPLCEAIESKPKPLLPLDPHTRNLHYVDIRPSGPEMALGPIPLHNKPRTSQPSPKAAAKFSTLPTRKQPPRFPGWEPTPQQPQARLTRYSLGAAAPLSLLGIVWFMEAQLTHPTAPTLTAASMPPTAAPAVIRSLESIPTLQRSPANTTEQQLELVASPPPESALELPPNLLATAPVRMRDAPHAVPTSAIDRIDSLHRHRPDGLGLSTPNKNAGSLAISQLSNDRSGNVISNSNSAAIPAPTWEVAQAAAAQQDLNLPTAPTAITLLPHAAAQDNMASLHGGTAATHKDIKLSTALAPIETSTSARETSNQAFFLAQSHRVVTGDSLWRLALNNYREAFLWPHIYHANHPQLSNPNQLETGQHIDIPTLWGSPKALTEADRQSVAQGYFLLYELYYRSGNPHAHFALLAVNRYHPATYEKQRWKVDIRDQERLIKALQN